MQAKVGILGRSSGETHDGEGHGDGVDGGACRDAAEVEKEQTPVTMADARGAGGEESISTSVVVGEAFVDEGIGGDRDAETGSWHDGGGQGEQDGW